MFLGLSVFLFLCLLDYATQKVMKEFRWNFLGGWGVRGPRTKWLHFGDNPDHDSYPEIFKKMYSRLYRVSFIRQMIALVTAKVWAVPAVLVKIWFGVVLVISSKYLYCCQATLDCKIRARLSKHSRATRPIGRRWSPLPQPSARHQLTLRDHGYGASVSRGVPVYSSAFARPTHGGMARLSWPGWLLTYRDGFPSADGHPSKY